MAQLEGSQAEGILLLCRFALFRPSTDWMGPTHIGGQSTLLSQLIRMLILSSNTLTDNQVGPVKVTDKINHHT